MASKNLEVLKIDDTDIPNDVGRNISSDSPLVFRCMSCGTIIGDSTDWITANEKLRAITLVRVTSKVQCGRTLLSSATGDDMGSAYHVLTCEQCKAEFGKMYKTTPSHLDNFRNRFTFNIDKIDSYQIGCAEQGVNDNVDLLTVPVACKVLSKIKKLEGRVSALENARLIKTEIKNESIIAENDFTISALENVCQSKTTNKHESNDADNNITNMPAIVNSVHNSSASGVCRDGAGSLKYRSHTAGLHVASSPQTIKRINDESNAAKNDVSNMPAIVNSMRNSSASGICRDDAGSLKRRSHAVGLYVTSSPQTMKRINDESNAAENDITNMPTCVGSLDNSSALEDLSSIQHRSHAAELCVASSPQTLKRSKDKPSVAENDTTNMPACVDSLSSNSALEVFRADSGSLKRRSNAAGLYVISSPKTPKRSKVHK